MRHNKSTVNLIIILIFLTLTVMFFYRLANVGAAQPCQYPTVNIWLTGGNINMAQGAYQAHACPLPTGQHRLTVRRTSPTRIVVGVLPLR